MSVSDRVDTAFRRLAAGELPASQALEDGGWEAVLPSGRVTTRGALRNAAGELIAMGVEAVPALVTWIAHDNPALRYVAIYSLDAITGVKSGLSPFIAGDQDGARDRAVTAWRSATDRAPQG